MADRQRCAEKLQNANGNPSLSLAERMRHIVAAVRWPKVTNYPFFCGEGSIGRRTVIECPFRCMYGYNTTIGNEVRIGMGCTIVDAGSVYIGD